MLRDQEKEKGRRLGNRPWLSFIKGMTANVPELTLTLKGVQLACL